ncbi:MAG: chemotaxis protein CheW [Thermoanaerobaculia bacterium]
MVNLADLRKKKKKEEKKEETPQAEVEKREETLKKEKEIAKEEKLKETVLKEEKGGEVQKELYLSFRIGKEIYGIPIDYVQEIIPLHPITKVPNAPEEIMGIISIRGMVLPVINIGIFLGQKLSEYNENTRLIILKVNDEMISIIVDSVYQNIEIPLNLIEPPPSTVKDEKGLIFGVYPYKRKLLVLLKAEQI